MGIGSQTTRPARGRMKAILMFVSIVFLAVVSTSLQSATPPPKPPKDVVAEYWRLETQGARLTPDGWLKTNNFFIRPRQPHSYGIHVIANHDHGRIDKTARTENWAEVYVGILETGELDSALRFKRSPDEASSGGPIGATLIKVDLVLTDKHWEALERNGIVTSTSHKCDGFSNHACDTFRYVTV
jgi:hypothetical protein